MSIDRFHPMTDPSPNELPTTSISPWQYKPWWCQPWSILLTGITLIAGSWLTLKLIWVTVLVAIPICCWMGFFLLLWPRLVTQEILLHSDRE